MLHGVEIERCVVVLSFESERLLKWIDLKQPCDHVNWGKAVKLRKLLHLWTDIILGILAITAQLNVDGYFETIPPKV